MTSIMIIDDDDLLVRAMEIALKSKGYDVISARGGEEGLNMLKTAKPDLILLDLMMPGMNGWKTLEKIKSNGLSPIPVIIVTVKDQTSVIKQKKEELGFSEYLTKPFDLDILFSKIEKALQL